VDLLRLLLLLRSCFHLLLLLPTAAEVAADTEEGRSSRIEAEMEVGVDAWKGGRRREKEEGGEAEREGRKRE